MLGILHPQSPYEGNLVTVLGTRIGEISRISPLVRAEMSYVSKLWKTDLEEHLDRELKLKLPIVTVTEGPDWLFTPTDTQPLPKKKKGIVIKASKSGTGKRARPQKCWYCLERHAPRNTMCPMAMRNPEEWKKMTKIVGGWRATAGKQERLMGKKIVFEN